MRALTEEQKQIIAACVMRERLAVWADMGAGKTAITLHAVLELLKLGFIRRAVVVAPRAVADSTWRQEAEAWPSTRSLRVVTLRGTQAQRKAQAATPADVYCIGRDGLADKNASRGCIASADLLTLARDAENTLLIIDEASSFKNPTSRRFRALAFFRWGRVIELTGTPTPQSIADVWSQVYLLDRGASLGKTITAFRRRFLTQKYCGFGYDPRPGAESEILSLIKPLIFRLEAPPPCEVERIDVESPLTPAEFTEYKKFAEEMVAQIEGTEITAASAGALTSKLAAWASGGQYHRLEDSEEREVLRPHYRKREALTALFRRRKPTFLVLYWFNFTVDDVKAAAQAARLSFALFDSKKPEIVEAWNAGKVDVLAAHPMSAGMGLNLQHGGHTEVWVTLPWSSELWLQTVARLARRGQTERVEVIRIITPGTIDERISKVLGGKIDLQKLILDEVRETGHAIHIRGNLQQPGEGNHSQP